MSVDVKLTQAKLEDKWVRSIVLSQSAYNRLRVGRTKSGHLKIPRYKGYIIQRRAVRNCRSYILIYDDPVRYNSALYLTKDEIEHIIRNAE